MGNVVPLFDAETMADRESDALLDYAIRLCDSAREDIPERYRVGELSPPTTTTFQNNPKLIPFPSRK